MTPLAPRSRRGMALRCYWNSFGRLLSKKGVIYYYTSAMADFAETGISWLFQSTGQDLWGQVDHRAGDGLHEQPVHELLIGQEEMTKLFGNRGDEVVVVARQKFRFPGFEPITHPASMTGWTSPVAAAVVHPERVIAIAATILMAAHLSRHAGGDVSQRLLLGGHHQMPELVDITVLEPADHVRQFDTVVFHGRSLR